MKKRRIPFLVLMTFFLLTACQANSSDANASLVIGSKGSDAEIWNFIADSQAAEEAGLAIEVQDITEGPQLNQATAEGEIDANAFQNIAYLNEFNADSPDKKLAVVGATYYEPFGLYSKKHQNLDQLPDGASIGLADYPSDQARGLQLLAKQGLIELDKKAGGEASLADITANPKNLQFKEMDENTLPRVLEDMDAAAFGNTIAMEAGLSVFDDTLFYEEVSEDNDQVVNILACLQGREKEEDLQKLIQIYHSPEVQDFIKDQFDGTKIPVQMNEEEIQHAVKS